MKLAILYGRNSTDRQDNSIQVQNEKNLAYLASKEMVTLPELQFDAPDTSGRVPIWEREGGKQAVDILRQGLSITALSEESIARLVDDGADITGPTIPVRCIVLSKVDRMGRNAKDMLAFLEWIEKHAYELHVVDFFGDSFCNQTPMGRIIAKVMFGMLALFAELEVETIRNRIREVFESKRARNELCGKPAYGQRAVPSGRYNKRNSEIMLAEADPQETAWLLQMIAWRQAGWSYAAIARELNAQGVPPKTPAGTPVGCRTGGTVPASGQWTQGGVAHALSSLYARLLVERTRE
jgi:DNA invertase Pin-like site-specific DNA recombinase